MSEKKTNKVEEKKAPEVVVETPKPVEPVPAPARLDVPTVMFILYLMYKNNMITRDNLRQMLDSLKKPAPDDVISWLVIEAAR